MTRKRKCSSTPHIDEGSSSMTAPSEAPWFGRAIFTHQPNQHWKKPAPNVIAHFDGLMKATNQNLATIHRYKRRGRLLLKKQRHMPLHCNYVEGEFEILLQRLKAKVNRISRKLKLFHIRSQSIIQGIPSVERFNLGALTCICEHCGASMWREESTAKTRNRPKPCFTLYCNDGAVNLPLGREPPSYLSKLIYSDNAVCHHFCENIRKYNAIFFFTSLGGKVNWKINNGTSPYMYSIGGQIFHRIGSLLPPEGCAPQFAQLYIVDTENEVENRMNSITDGGESCSLNVTIVNNLKDIYRIQLEVRDDTDESDFVLLDHLAESILGLTAKKLYELNGNETEIPPVLVMNLMDKSMKIQVQVNEYNIRIARNEFTITKILDAPKEHVENLGESPPSSDSLKSCVSNLGTTSSKLSTVIEKAGKKFKGAAVTYNDEMEDEFSDDAALATMRKKQRKYHISDDE
ncbi:hypothetical protein LINPERPRIM_LOCUS6377 [Linum perenne]